MTQSTSQPTPPAGVPPVPSELIERNLGGPMLTPPPAASQRIERVEPKSAVAPQAAPQPTRATNPTFDQPDAETARLRQLVANTRASLGQIVATFDSHITTVAAALEELSTPAGKKIAEAENFKPADASKFIDKIDSAINSVKPVEKPKG